MVLLYVWTCVRWIPPQSMSVSSPFLEPSSHYLYVFVILYPHPSWMIPQQSQCSQSIDTLIDQSPFVMIYTYTGKGVSVDCVCYLCGACARDPIACILTIVRRITWFTIFMTTSTIITNRIIIISDNGTIAKITIRGYQALFRIHTCTTCSTTY